jgi:FlaA1/EpsC-like NDP-sugar epimerase
LTLLKDKTVMLTGAAGTVGRELIKHILKQEPRELRVIDNNESEIFNLEEEYGHSYRGYSSGDSPTASMFHAYVGDIRDPDKLRRKMTGVDVVFHVAALKHVVLCERSPFDAVQTNINGVKNIIDCALENNVERVIFTSSDKAVNPTSVMGTSKLMGERLISAANSMKMNHRTIFSSTRFGNVIGSRGSVVPIFYRQIKEGGPITLTDSNMTRFVMTIEESARLVLQAAELAKGGEVFVTKMVVIRIKDLAEAMIEMITGKADSVEIKEIGPKPGEKLYEELMTDEETGRALELEEMFSVLPAFRHVYEDIDYSYPNVVTENVDDPYVSSNSTPLNIEEIKSYLIEHKILEKIAEGGN